MYEDKVKALSCTNTSHTIVMGDFNAETEEQEYCESRSGPFGYGCRNYQGVNDAKLPQGIEALFDEHFFSTRSPKGSGPGEALTM